MAEVREVSANHNKPVSQAAKPAEAAQPAKAVQAAQPQQQAKADAQDKVELSDTAKSQLTVDRLGDNVALSPPRTYSTIPDCSQEQCAEWVQRVFRENGKPLPVHGDAGDLFGQNWPEGYQKQSNGTPGLPPQAGDLLTWGRGSGSAQWGHVAMVKEVNRDANPPYVEIVEANYGKNDGQNVPTRRLEYDPATNSIKNTGNMQLQGWIHPEGEHSLVNAQPGQKGNVDPNAAASVPRGSGAYGNTGGFAPGNAPAYGNPTQDVGGGFQGPQQAGAAQNQTDQLQQVQMLIDAATQEVMMGNLNGKAVNELYAWFQQNGGLSQMTTGAAGASGAMPAMNTMGMGSPMQMNPMDILKAQAATVLMMAGKLGGMNMPGGMGMGGSGMGMGGAGFGFPMGMGMYPRMM